MQKLRRKFLGWLAFDAPRNWFTDWITPYAIGWLMGARAKRVK